MLISKIIIEMKTQRVLTEKTNKFLRVCIYISPGLRKTDPMSLT